MSKRADALFLFAVTMAAVAVAGVVCFLPTDAEAAQPDDPQPPEFRKMEPRDRFDDRGMGMPPAPGHGPMKPFEGRPLIIDATDRPDLPEDIIETYGNAYMEMKKFEENGGEAFIMDRNRDMDPELFGILENAIGEPIIGSFEEIGDADVMEAGQCEKTDITEFLIMMYTSVEGTGSTYEVILYQMIEGRSSGNGSCASVSENRGFIRIKLTVTVEDGSEEESDDQTYVDIPTKPTSTEEYLRAHVFDGGTQLVL